MKIGGFLYLYNMKPWESYIEKLKADEDTLILYRKMRKSLQDFNVHEWQLKKGYKIPGAIYTYRAEAIAEKFKLEEKLKNYGLLPSEDVSMFNNYFLNKFKEIDDEYPLQKGEEPDYMDDED